MNFFHMLADIGRGAAESAAIHQTNTDPKMRRAAAKRSEGCTPCAASAYVEKLQSTFSAPAEAPKRRRKKAR